MKRGFTILELLVASLLLGMLVTILTMIFNQSSIAWRTGVAGVANMDKARINIAEVREEADNLFFCSNRVGRITSLWNDDGDLRVRAFGLHGQYSESDSDQLPVLAGESYLSDTKSKLNQMEYPYNTNAKSKSEGGKSYTVGVTSWGPDGEANNYDDITSWPDVIE